MRSEWRRWHANTFDPVARCGTARSVTAAGMALAGAQKVDRKSGPLRLPISTTNVTTDRIRLGANCLIETPPQT